MKRARRPPLRQPGATTGPSEEPSSVEAINATEQYLFIFGGVLEFAGIMAVAWPDLLPYGERLSAWLGRAYRSAYQRTADLMRQFSRRPRGVIVQAPAATLTLAGAGVTGRATVQPDATDEEKVEYLVKRDQAGQAMFDSLSHMWKSAWASPDRVEGPRRE